MIVLKKKIFIITLLSLITIKSCNRSKDIIEADLTFKSISFMSAYGASDEEYKKLLDEIDSVLQTNSKTETFKLYQYFDNLKNEKLLRNPYIFIKTREDSVLTIYLSEKEYQKIKNYKYIDLSKEEKKVSVKIKLSKKSNGILYCDEIIKINLLKGKSSSNL